MSKAKEVVLGVFLIVIVFLSGCIAVRWATDRPIRRVEQKVDTLYYHDTIFVPDPVKTDEKETEKIFIPVLDKARLDSLEYIIDSLSWENGSLEFKNDSLMIALQITQAYYHKDSLYDIWVSGWNPSLDSVRVFKDTEYIMVDRIQTIEQPRWGFHVAVGPGVFADVNGNVRLGAGVVAGLGYRF